MISKLSIDEGHIKMVHWEGVIECGTDHTLCGLETAGDSEIGIKPARESSRPVDCPVCLSIVKHCEEILSMTGK